MKSDTTLSSKERIKNLLKDAEDMGIDVERILSDTIRANINLKKSKHFEKHIKREKEYHMKELTRLSKLDEGREHSMLFEMRKTEEERKKKE